MLHLLLVLILLEFVAGENGIEAWLRYAPLPHSYRSRFTVPSTIVSLNSSNTSPVHTAGQELQQGIKGIFRKTVEVCHERRPGLSIVVGTIDEYVKTYGPLNSAPRPGDDGFWFSNSGKIVQILGQNKRGALYGALEYLSMLAQGNFSKVEYATNPNGQFRWVNQWCVLGI